MNTNSENDGWTVVTAATAGASKAAKYVPPHMKDSAVAAAPSVQAQGAAPSVQGAAPSVAKYVPPGMRAPVADMTPILGFAPPTASPALQAAMASAPGAPVKKAYVPPAQRSNSSSNKVTGTFDEMFPVTAVAAAAAAAPASWQGGNFLEFLKNKELAALNEAPIDNGILASHTNVLTGKTFVARDLVLEESDDDDGGGYVGPKNFYERQEVRLQQQAAMRLQMLRQRYGFEEPEDGSTGSVQESHEDDDQGDFYDNNSDSNEGEEEEVYSD